MPFGRDTVWNFLRRGEERVIAKDLHIAVAVTVLALSFAGATVWSALFSICIALRLWLTLQESRRYCASCSRHVASSKAPLQRLEGTREHLSEQLRIAESRLAVMQASCTSLAQELERSLQARATTANCRQGQTDSGVPSGAKEDAEHPRDTQAETDASADECDGTAEDPTAEPEAPKEVPGGDALLCGQLRPPSMYAVCEMDGQQLQKVCTALAVFITWAHEIPEMAPPEEVPAETLSPKTAASSPGLPILSRPVSPQPHFPLEEDDVVPESTQEEEEDAECNASEAYSKEKFDETPEAVQESIPNRAAETGHTLLVEGSASPFSAAAEPVPDEGSVGAILRTRLNSSQQMPRAMGDTEPELVESAAEVLEAEHTESAAEEEDAAAEEEAPSNPSDSYATTLGLSLASRGSDAEEAALDLSVHDGGPRIETEQVLQQCSLEPNVMGQEALSSVFENLSGTVEESFQAFKASVAARFASFQGST